MTFAEQLKAERKRLGITQDECANLLSVSKRWVWKSENDESTPLEITQEGALARLKSAKPKKP